MFSSGQLLKPKTTELCFRIFIFIMLCNILGVPDQSSSSLTRYLKNCLPGHGDCAQSAGPGPIPSRGRSTEAAATTTTTLARNISGQRSIIPDQDTPARKNRVVDTPGKGGNGGGARWVYAIWVSASERRHRHRATSGVRHLAPQLLQSCRVKADSRRESPSWYSYPVGKMKDVICLNTVAKIDWYPSCTGHLGDK